MATRLTMCIIYGIFCLCATWSSTEAFMNGNSSDIANISANTSVTSLFEGNVSHSENVSEYGSGNDTNTTYIEDYDYYIATPKATIIILVIFGFILLVGIIGNILVLIIIAAVKSMRTTVNISLFSLAVADLVILCFLPIEVIRADFTNYKAPISPGLCYFLSFYDRGAVACSAFIFFYITIDRYFALCHPLKSRALWTGKKTYVILVLIWVASLALSYPYFHVSTFKTYSYKNVTYYYCYYADKPWLKWYDTVFRILLFYTLTPVLVILYGRMIYRIKGSVPKFGSGREGDNVTGRRGRRQVVVLLLVVVVIYILTQLPFSALVFLFYFCPNVFKFGLAKTQFIVIWTCRLLIYVNSAANPVIYFSLSTKFRQSFLQVFRCHRRKGSQGKIQETTISSIATQ